MAASVEAGWQTLALQERTIEALLHGDVTNHELLVVASAILYAVPLRTVSRLADWQKALGVCPPTLGEVLITSAVQRWSWPHWLDAR